MKKPLSSDSRKKVLETRGFKKSLAFLFLDVKNRKFLFASVVFHALIVAFFLFSWQSTEKFKVLKLPNNIHARVLSTDEMQKLKASEQAKLQKIADQKKKLEKQKVSKRKALREKAKREKALADKKALQIKKKAQEKKKALAKRKALAKTKALAKKKAKEKAARERAEKEKLRIEKELVEKELIEKELEAQNKSDFEERLLKKMQAIQTQESEHQKSIDEKRRLDSIAAQSSAAQEYELTEIEKYYFLIRQKIESRWHVPPKSSGLSLLLRIQLLPTGELSGVKVVESSGSKSFDKSAENAVKSVRLFPVSDDKAFFERNFRQFSMRFTPESK